MLTMQQVATSSCAAPSNCSLHSRQPPSHSNALEPNTLAVLTKFVHWDNSSIFSHAHNRPAATVDLGLMPQEPRTAQPVARHTIAVATEIILSQSIALP